MINLIIRIEIVSVYALYTHTKLTFYIFVNKIKTWIIWNSNSNVRIVFTQFRKYCKINNEYSYKMMRRVYDWVFHILSCKHGVVFALRIKVDLRTTFIILPFWVWYKPVIIGNFYCGLRVLRNHENFSLNKDDDIWKSQIPVMWQCIIPLIPLASSLG